jgi:hypothetical protein
MNSLSFEAKAEVLEPACHALEHCVQATSVVEKMKSITKGYRLVNNKVGRLKSMYLINKHVHFQLRRKALNLSQDSNLRKSEQTPPFLTK